MTSPKLLSKLTLERIRPWFDDGSFQRGTDYWKTGHVRRVKATEEGVELAIQSSVSGSRSLVYHQEIEVYEYDGLIELSGECSCPVSFNCKHVVAVLCDLIDRYAITASSGEIDKPVEEWLGKLSETTALSEQSDSGGEPKQDSIQLQYLINPEPADVAGSRFKIKASVFKSRVLKKGGYGKPVKHSFDRLGVGHYFDDFVTPADKLIGSLVGKQTS
ncbi:MAG: SWIM zinc finger family protein, partial [Arenicellales bacterium]